MFNPSLTQSGLAYAVAVEGLADIDFSTVPEAVKRFASQAINATARRYRTESSRRIREQVAFPARYLDSKSDGNLQIVRTATPTNLEAAIQGRFRATSMTRFVRGPVVHGRRSPTVEVAPGKRETMKRAFIMNLRSGNKGLAVRLAPGERIENKKRMVRMNNGLYLLYGPSVDQVFRDVAADVSEEASEYMENEFLRLAEALQ